MLEASRMLASAWYHFLYQPLLNALFLLYDKAAGDNLGLAVIELTIAMRMVLLPISILSERNKGRMERVSRKIATIRQQFKNDPVKLREEARKLFRSHKVRPWSKMVVLGVQVLVFVLLYQVFIGGLSSSKLTALYDSVWRPDVVNTMFFGFDIAQRNIGWSLSVGVLLFVEIVLEQAQRKQLLERRDILYRYLFPIAVTIILAQLPMVKCIFLLTTMAFTAMLFGVRKGVMEKES